MDARLQEGPSLRVLRRSALPDLGHWQNAFAGKRKDHRYYEICEDTLSGYDYLYLVIADATGCVRAVQPAFVVDQDLLAGMNRMAAPMRAIRKLWPRFLKLRTLMVGCVAGEGCLDGGQETHAVTACALGRNLAPNARELGARLIVCKEFPARHRADLAPLEEAGFTRIPSMPMTRRFIGYRDFEDYMTLALNGATRRKLRKKFRKAGAAEPIAMEVLSDAAPVIDEIFPLYLAVYERSALHFEKLTPEYFREIGCRMPDKARFFVWRQEKRIVAFTLVLLEGDQFYAEYVGLDYRVALDLHLWHVVVRDMTEWAIAHGFHWFCSSGLNYDPKLHLRHALDPIDLYVRHTNPFANAVLRRILPLIEPTRYDPTLKKFANYADLR